MEAEEIYKVVKKLIGNIEPVGETNEDNRRMENLKEIIDLTHGLLLDIEFVSTYKDRVEYSVKEAGEKASYFLKTLHQEIDLSQEE